MLLLFCKSKVFFLHIVKMNATGAIPIENRFTLESDMVNYLNQHDGYFRVYRYFTTKMMKQEHRSSHYQEIL